MINISFPSDVSLRSVLKIRKFVYLPFLTIAITALMVVTVIAPNLQQIFRFRKEIAVSSSELEALTKKAEALQSFSEDELLDKVEKLEKVLPSNKAILPWMQGLNGLASESGVVLGAFSISPGSLATESGDATASASQRAQKRQPAERKSEIDSLGIVIEVVGSFAGVRDFLIGVENMAPVMRLTSADLSSIAPQTGPEFGPLLIARDVQSHLAIDMLFAPLPTQLGSITDPVPLADEALDAVYERATGLKRYELEIPTNVATGRENIFAPL